MKGILVDELVKVYAEPNDQTLSITTIRKGDEIELGKVSKKKKQVWVEVKLTSGQTGYIGGDTKVFMVKKIQLLADGIQLFAEAVPESAVLKTYVKNTVITAIGIIKDDAEDDYRKGFLKVTDENGATGYIKAGEKVRVYQEATIEGGKKLMFTGGMFAFLAAAFYIFALTRGETNSNLSILTVAVLAFGLMQFIQGILQYNKARNKGNDRKKD